MIGYNNNGEELIFVNIAGNIDMERIAMLGERYGLPGLDELPPKSEVDKERAEAAKAAKDEKSLE